MLRGAIPKGAAPKDHFSSCREGRLDRNFAADSTWSHLQSAGRHLLHSKLALAAPLLVGWMETPKQIEGRPKCAVGPDMGIWGQQGALIWRTSLDWVGSVTVTFPSANFQIAKEEDGIASEPRRDATLHPRAAKRVTTSHHSCLCPICLKHGLQEPGCNCKQGNSGQPSTQEATGEGSSAGESPSNAPDADATSMPPPPPPAKKARYGLRRVSKIERALAS